MTDLSRCRSFFKAIIPAIIVIVAPAILHAQQVQFPTTVIAKQDATADLPPLPASRVLSWAQISGDFASNATAALGKYNGKRLTIIGRVSKISQGASENKAMEVTLQNASASTPAVRGNFLQASIPENSEIEISPDGTLASMLHRDERGNILNRTTYVSVDQIVGIKGDFQNLKDGDIVLTNCQLVKGKKLKKLRHEIEGNQ